MVSYTFSGFNELEDLSLQTWGADMNRHNLIMIKSKIGVLYVFKMGLFSKGLVLTKMVKNPLHTPEMHEVVDKIIGDIKTHPYYSLYIVLFLTMATLVNLTGESVKITML